MSQEDHLKKKKKVYIVGKGVTEDDTSENAKKTAEKKEGRMNPPVLINYQVGDDVRMKKTHPCGSREWEILRTGADFKLRCLGCGREIMMSRHEFEKAVRKKG